VTVGSACFSAELRLRHHRGMRRHRGFFYATVAPPVASRAAWGASNKPSVQPR
jgi:hypothetical protein